MDAGRSALEATGGIRGATRSRDQGCAGTKQEYTSLQPSTSEKIDHHDSAGLFGSELVLA
ncbi:hypothetical protein XH88_09535 [Bradyrhizobium sp. CCBAU 51627]|nr:hypothetical protein [Bradyrhizobium sp. CCBAU 51627]